MKNELNIKSECIYNPLDAHLIKVKSQKKIKFNFFKRNTLNLINIGRLTDQKDQTTILKAINLIKNSIKLKLLIIGKGTELYNLNKYIINISEHTTTLTNIITHKYIRTLNNIICLNTQPCEPIRPNRQIHNDIGHKTVADGLTEAYSQGNTAIGFIAGSHTKKRWVC